MENKSTVKLDASKLLGFKASTASATTSGLNPVNQLQAKVGNKAGNKQT